MADREYEILLDLQSITSPDPCRMGPVIDDMLDKCESVGITECNRHVLKRRHSKSDSESNLFEITCVIRTRSEFESVEPIDSMSDWMCRREPKQRSRERKIDSLSSKPQRMKEIHPVSPMEQQILRMWLARVHVWLRIDEQVREEPE